MADSSLDDFFAKKDKSRKKTKTKSGPVGEEEGSGKASKKDKKKKERDRQTSSGGTVVGGVLLHQQEDEEWKDFEEEKKIDYTGLRIQTLQMSKEEQDRDGGDGIDNGDDDDESRDRRDGVSGPWNKSGTTTSSVPAHASQTELPKEESTPKAPTKYIPPAQRQGALSASSTTSLLSSRKKREAPNVHSEEDFPTLGGPPASGKWSSHNYISTGSSNLMDNTTQRKSINLTLENKFSALQD